MDNNDNKIVGKYLKKFGLSRAKQIVYIMRTSEDEYPKNKYPNWKDYVKVISYVKPSEFPLAYDGYFFICSNTIEELEYQIEQVKK